MNHAPNISVIYVVKKRMAIEILRRWGVLGLYEFLAGVREDVQWAADAA